MGGVTNRVALVTAQRRQVRSGDGEAAAQTPFGMAGDAAGLNMIMSQILIKYLKLPFGPIHELEPEIKLLAAQQGFVETARLGDGFAG